MPKQKRVEAVKCYAYECSDGAVGGIASLTKHDSFKVPCRLIRESDWRRIQRQLKARRKGVRG